MRHRAIWAALLAAAVLAAGCSNAGGTPGTGPAAGHSALSVSPVPTTSSVPETSAPSSPETSAPSPSTPTPVSPSTTTSVSMSASSTAAPTPSASSPSSSSAPPRGGLPPAYLPGVNDPDCRSDHRPVVLLHGTLGSTKLSFSALAPVLLSSGWCVFALDYGNGGLGPVRDSAADLASLVTTVRRVTGATTVDLVGYSQGGLVIRAALRLDGLAPMVRTVVLIAPSFHGTTAPAATKVPELLCQACHDQAAGSGLLRQLDAGGDLDGTVRYAVVSTERDTVVTPVSSQVPAGPPDRVRSILVEQRCPGLRTDHVGLPAVPGVISWVRAALANDGRPQVSALTCG